MITRTDLLMIVGLSILFGFGLARAITWARKNLGRCRRCHAPRTHCACIGGPR